MTLTARPLSRVALAGAAVLAVTGLAAVAPPATAISGTLNYDCTVRFAPQLGTQVFTAILDTDVPEQVRAGQYSDFQVTASVTVPPDLVTYLNSTTAVTVGGLGQVGMDINANFWDSNMSWPQTVVPASGTMQLTWTGWPSSGPLPPAPVGTVWEITARSGIWMEFTGYRADGSVTGKTLVDCVVQSGQSQHMDTVHVVQAPSTTTLTVQPSPIEYGAQPTVVADIAVTGSKTKPTGTVAFGFEGQTVTADVVGGQAKASLAAALTMGLRQVTAVFTPTDPNIAPNQAASSVKVIKDQSSTIASLVYRHASNRLVGKSRVVPQHNASVTGLVKLVLKRDGAVVRSVKARVNTFGTVKKVFKNISKAGKYTLVARYLGSPTLESSVHRAKLVV